MGGRPALPVCKSLHPMPASPSPARLTVKVGLAWSPFDRESVPGPGFWRAVEAREELG